MNRSEYLQKLKQASPEILAMSLDQCHADGLFSLVFSGIESGKLTRAFIAKKGIKPFEVQLHSHRYDLIITVLKGEFRHHTAAASDPQDGLVLVDEFIYLSPLNGGNGLELIGQSSLILDDYLVPATGCIKLAAEDIHTVSCTPGTIWIVEELGFVQDSSFAYGKNFITENLYLKPSQYQINDAVQVVIKALQP